MSKLTVISLGAGVQSSVMALMAAEADLADPAADQIVMDFGDECDGMCGV
tara:strand:+ start:53 stop:202 length:150 start_codon:yes stop_codon:yes gene_type:complete